MACMRRSFHSHVNIMLGSRSSRCRMLLFVWGERDHAHSITKQKIKLFSLFFPHLRRSSLLLSVREFNYFQPRCNIGDRYDILNYRRWIRKFGSTLSLLFSLYFFRVYFNFPLLLFCFLYLPVFVFTCLFHISLPS